MIPSHLINSLATAANTAIDNVLRTGAPGQTIPTGEVGFVAAVTVGGVYDIATAWNSILQPHNLSVKMNGVFCHQSPKVNFTDSHGSVVSCELADLLVVVEDYTSGSTVRRWASLMQAKMASSRGGQTLSQPGDLRQLDLFLHWHPFTLSGKYAAGKRDFSNCTHPGSHLNCGRYGLIAGQPNPDWHQQRPAIVMPAGGDKLGTYFANMVETGQTGYGREATGVGDDWSRTVDELMTRTYARFFTYSAGFSSRQARGHSAFATIFDTNLDYYVLYPDGVAPPSGRRPDEPDDEDPDDGISVLRIGVWETE